MAMHYKFAEAERLLVEAAEWIEPPETALHRSNEANQRSLISTQCGMMKNQTVATTSKPRSGAVGLRNQIDQCLDQCLYTRIAIFIE